MKNYNLKLEGKYGKREKLWLSLGKVKGILFVNNLDFDRTFEVFTKQKQSPIPLSVFRDSSLQEGYLRSVLEEYESKSNFKNYIELCENAIFDRVDHSTDWKEIRKMEKGDIKALLFSISPILELARFAESMNMKPHNQSVFAALCEAWHWYYRKDLDSRFTLLSMQFQLLLVLVNMWLFDSRIQSLVDSVRRGYRSDANLSENDKAFFALSVYLSFMACLLEKKFDHKVVDRWVHQD